jgi:UDP-2-acetamido-2,6-beta-L-arabino-hexul-4-ose reductase
MTGAVVVTGAGGFLGWHVRVVADAMGMPSPATVSRDGLHDQPSLVGALDGADRVVHLAGVNRGSDEEVWAGNLEAAMALARAVQVCRTPPKTLVFANSIHAGNGSAYGSAKAAAAQILAEAARSAEVEFLDERLPNVYGEHGRPHYNSVVASFCRLLADGGELEIHQDRELDLLHATDAAAALLGLGHPGPVVRRSVRQIAEQLRHFAAVYRAGEIPELRDRFDVRLFNTYRSHCFPRHYPIRLPKSNDARGELVEAVRVHGGGGQTFWSSTRPGATRGEHYHLFKVERFAVVSGEAEICVRRLLTSEVVRFRVSGSEPVAIDMPTMWIHNMTNVSDRELVAAFWANDLHEPASPDTYPGTVFTP